MALLHGAGAYLWSQGEYGLAEPPMESTGYASTSARGRRLPRLSTRLGSLTK